MVARCLSKKILGSNNRKSPSPAFFRKRDLPEGWIPWEVFCETFMHECYDETCGKRLDTAQKLKNHMISVHGEEEYALWKDDIEDEIKREAAERRTQRQQARARAS
jgi:hypothetical protein